MAIFPVQYFFSHTCCLLLIRANTNIQKPFIQVLALNIHPRRRLRSWLPCKQVTADLWPRGASPAADLLTWRQGFTITGLVATNVSHYPGRRRIIQPLSEFLQTLRRRRHSQNCCLRKCEVQRYSTRSTRYASASIVSTQNKVTV